MSCNEVSASDLLYRISIEERTATKGTLGSVSYSWAEITGGAVSAAIDWKSGNENQVLTKETAKTVVIFKIRYLSTVTPKMRIVYDGDNFDILHHPLTIGRKQFQEIKAQLIE